MEAPAAASIAISSLSQRLRLLLSLLLAPPHADNPAAGLARSIVTLTPRVGPHTAVGARMDVANVRGFDLFRNTVADLEHLSPANPRRYEDEPPIAWRHPTQRSAILHSVAIFRLTAAYDALGSALPRWHQRRAQAALPQPQSHPVSRRQPNGPGDPRNSLVARPSSARWEDHVAWLYHAQWHAPPSAAGEIHDATAMSWIGPGGSGRLVALSCAPTHVAATIMRARLGASALQLFPFSLDADVQPPLSAAERIAVCRVCKRESPSDRLMLCDCYCAQALHHAPGCIAQDARDRPGRLALSPTSTQRPPKWFCSDVCKAYHDNFYAQRYADADQRRADALCRICPADDAVPAAGGTRDQDDLWHILFICNQRDIRSLQRQMLSSAAVHALSLLSSLEQALLRAKAWYPGLRTLRPSLAIRDARDVIERIAPDRDQQPPCDTSIDRHAVYRLVLALPFPEAVIPPAPPPGSTDPYAVSRALGRVFDAVALPRTFLRRTATLAVTWADSWIRRFAATRRRARAALAGRNLDRSLLSALPVPGPGVGEELDIYAVVEAEDRLLDDRYLDDECADDDRSSPDIHDVALLAAAGDAVPVVRSALQGAQDEPEPP